MHKFVVTASGDLNVIKDGPSHLGLATADPIGDGAFVCPTDVILLVNYILVV